MSLAVDRRMGARVPQVSLVIPVLNDADSLRRCLTAIKAQSSSIECEIIVLDNGSADQSAAVARSFGASVTRMAGVRVSALRNDGIRRARGELVGLIDADNEIADGWVDAACALFVDARVAAVGTSYSCPREGTWVQKAYDHLRGHPTQVRPVRWLATGNLVVRRSASLAIGGFDETLETCEDVDFCNRLRRHGYAIWADPRLRSTHYGDPATLLRLFKGELWRGRDALRVDLRGIGSWAEIPSMVLPLIGLVLVTTAFMTAALAWVLGSELLWWTIGAAGAIVGLSGVKVGRTLITGPPVGIGEIARLWAVAVVYDLARALALVTQVPHRRVLPAPAGRWYQRVSWFGSLRDKLPSWRWLQSWSDPPRRRP